MTKQIQNSDQADEVGDIVHGHCSMAEADAALEDNDSPAPALEEGPDDNDNDHFTGEPLEVPISSVCLQNLAMLLWAISIS